MAETVKKVVDEEVSLAWPGTFEVPSDFQSQPIQLLSRFNLLK
jgi:hypothetical protein